MPVKPAKPANAAALATWVAEKSMLFNDEESPFAASLAKGATKLAVVTGENVSGKSLFVQIAAQVCLVNDIVPVSLSIRERTGAGQSEMAGFRRIAMYGDEAEQSTGATSVSVVERGFSNLNHPQGSLLILDEPEMGLADSYSRAMGEFIGAQAREIPKPCRGVVVVTHSRELVRGLLEGFGGTPTHVAVSAEGVPAAGIEAWLESSESRSVEELLALRQVGLERWRATRKLIKN